MVLHLAARPFVPAEAAAAAAAHRYRPQLPGSDPFRDEHAAALGAQLVVGHVEDSIARGTVRLRSAAESRNAAQSVTLLEASRRRASMR